MGKETPRGLAKEGDGFLEAAKGVCTDEGCPKKNCLLVYYYLVCHSIELSCKAVLLSDGVPMKTLKGIGHDLSKLIMEIQRRGLGSDIESLDFSIIRMMNPDYRNRSYSYRKGGHQYKLVLPPLPVEVAARVSKFAFGYCEGSSGAEDEQ